jgi:dynein light intermediate chain 1
MHNTAGVTIIVACTKADLIDDNTDVVGGDGSGMSMVKRKGGEWEELTDRTLQILCTICLTCVCHFTLSPHVSHLHGVADGASATLNIQRQYALNVLFVPLPPTARSTAPWRQCVTHSFIHKPNTLVRHRMVILAGWDSWGNTVVLRGGFDTKARGEAWEHYLSSDDGLDLESDDSARKMYAALVQDQGIKVHFNIPPDLHFLMYETRSRPHTRLNNPTPDQAFLAKDYDENARRADRDSRGIFSAPTNAFAALKLVILLGSDGRAHASRDEGQQ